MDDATKQRLWGADHALDATFVRGFLVALVAILVLVPVVIWLMRVTGKSTPEHQGELWARYRSWLIFIPLMVGPILLGAAWTIVAVAS